MEQQPKHIYDAKSPMTMKRMDRDAVSSRDSCTGWSYCVTIPSWAIVPEATGSDAVVLYKIEVGIQSSKELITTTTTTTVLRRFHDFLKLFAALRKTFPKMNFPPTPPKAVLRNWTLVEMRRRSLEDLMKRLVNDVTMSRSIVLLSFLELEYTARSCVPDEIQQTVEGNHSVNKTMSPHTCSYSSESVVSDSTNTDMEDLRSQLSQEIAVKAYLSAKVKYLEGELETTKQRSKENLQQAVLIERERVIKMQLDMEELRHKSQQMEFKLKSQQKLLQQEKQRSKKEKVVMQKLTRECEVLHDRLRECSMNVSNKTEEVFRESSSAASFI